jgi:hypothetical protein
MDTSIHLVTPEMQRQRGAKAFDRRRADRRPQHEPGSTLRSVDWMRGWRLRQLETMRRPLTVQQLGRVSPP